MLVHLQTVYLKGDLLLSETTSHIDDANETISEAQDHESADFTSGKVEGEIDPGWVATFPTPKAARKVLF